ncbi:MAG: ADP-glyceromanno-heptose 6-epimerase [Lentimicrobiaceae bacterium]|nr:ADP-glyceromanno-heptose 6-epimerase [Lentimicrobiaceae bacterium]
MIVVTGAAGFIGSIVLAELNKKGNNDLILVDDFSKQNKERNFIDAKYNELIDRDYYFDWFENNHDNVEFVIHLGARTDTTEFDWSVFEKLNVSFTQKMFGLCAEYNIPLIYASSAATYGNGELAYDDNHEVVEKLQPLNPYGRSKNEVDKWILRQEKQPPFWAGLKFFNVYGPNEYHKGRMASVIFHSFNQITETGKVKLFRSHRPDFNDGEQLRDFIYVKDIANVIIWMIDEWQKKDIQSGLYNLGTGKARSFYDLAANTFKAMGREVNIEFIDIPEDIRDKYQYFTEANMNKLRAAGYDKDFTSLEDGVEDYVRNYLNKTK